MGMTIFKVGTSAVKMVLVFDIDGSSMNTATIEKIEDNIFKAFQNYAAELTKAIGARYYTRAIGKLEFTNGIFNEEEKVALESEAEMAMLRLAD